MVAMPLTIFSIRVVLMLALMALFSGWQWLYTALVCAALIGLFVFFLEAIGVLGWLLDVLGQPLPHNRRD